MFRCGSYIADTAQILKFGRSGQEGTERRSESPTLCTFYNADFIIYSSMGSFYMPCVAMLLCKLYVATLCSCMAMLSCGRAEPCVAMLLSDQAICGHVVFVCGHAVLWPSRAWPCC